VSSFYATEFTELLGRSGGFWAVHIDHAELVSWRIAHGQLIPDAALRTVMDATNRRLVEQIDWERLLREVRPDRVPLKHRITVIHEEVCAR
jgi:hypothetical protein